MGAKNYDGARQIIRKSFFISIVFDVLAAIILFFLRDYVVMFFQITNPVVKDNFNLIQDIVFVPFIMLIFLQIGRTLNIIYLVGPTSYGNLIANSLFSVINTWLLILVVGLTTYFCASPIQGHFLYGINGIYLLMALDEFIRGIFNLWWWKSNKWKDSFKRNKIIFI